MTATTTRKRLAIVVLSDPKGGGEEALGRLFNALTAARDARDEGDDVTLLFQGTGTRWLGELTRAEHPAAALFAAVRDRVAGAACGCAEVFEATSGVQACGVPLLGKPGASLPSLPGLSRQGYEVLVF